MATSEDTHMPSVSEQQQVARGHYKDDSEEKGRESPVEAAPAPEAARPTVKSTATAAGGGGEVGPQFKTADAYFALLARAKADTFALDPTLKPEQQPIWICNRDDKIVDVFSGLIKRNLSSVPVLLKGGAKYYGFLDLVDIVRYVVAHFGAAELSKKDWETKHFFDLLKAEHVFATKTVDDLMVYPHSPSRNPFHPVQAGYSALAVVEALARESGLHRVPVVDRRRQVVNLVTNSGVLKWLHDHMDELGSIVRQPLSAFKTPVIKPVLSVEEDAQALDAFNLMVTKGVVGVAVCNKEGRLRGNLSLRDLKVLGSDMALFWRLHQTVKNFTLKLRHEFQERHKRPRAAVYVLPSATLRDVLVTLHEHAIHRIYICNNHQEKVPIGICSIHDLLREIIEG